MRRFASSLCAMSDDQHIAAPLRLFNSLTRTIEPFAPIEDNHARV